MQNLLEYESFYESKKDDLFFARHNMPQNYADRARMYGIQAPGNSFFSKVSSFMGGLEESFDRFSQRLSSSIKARRAERGGGPNTGIESIFRLFSVVPGVLKKIFGPSVMRFKGADKDQVSLDLMRHTNDVYSREELPKIKSQSDLARNIHDLYGRSGYRPNQNPLVDELARNRAALYFSRNSKEVPMGKNDFETMPEIASL